MEEEFDGNLEIFKILRKVKRVSNFNIALMDREELKAYLVAEMEKFESKYPEMVEYIEPEEQGMGE